MRVIFDLRVGRSATYERRDHVYAMYGPLSLLILLLVWILFILAGYTLMFWGLGRPPATAFALSGSSIVTLGFEAPRDLPTTLLVLTEAWVGLVELALLITYLPTIYGAFQRREALVSMLEVRAGAPPSGVTMLERFYRLHTLDHLSGEVWEAWEGWFVDVEETHTSLPALNFFRSPQPHRSWITAAGAVLDGASLYASALESGSVTVATASVILFETIPPAIVGVIFLGDTTRHGLTGVAADRIDVTESGPAAGAIFLVLEHQGNTIVIEKGPGSAYTAEFQRILASFAFAAASG